eukprot:s290_g7.t1
MLSTAFVEEHRCCFWLTVRVVHVQDEYRSVGSSAPFCSQSCFFMLRFVLSPGPLRYAHVKRQTAKTHTPCTPRYLDDGDDHDHHERPPRLPSDDNEHHDDQDHWDQRDDRNHHCHHHDDQDDEGHHHDHEHNDQCDNQHH